MVPLVTEEPNEITKENADSMKIGRRGIGEEVGGG